ncbi:uncharacterized protein LOC109596027 [Aethina tumida]|uniref:uncharacterized protein LOC109596027 n=1 Tax=Aethina tumida TaxID=116153 RepID=UPI00096B0F5E|nr:uncharacterized protein LOC109596027 [Aethina tumida]
MKIIKCRYCMSFITDMIFASVRSRLTQKGVDWKSIVNTKLTPEQFYTHIPQIDHAFYNDHNFEIVLDCRGYEPKDVTASLSQDEVVIKAEREDKNMSKMYPGMPKIWDPDSGDCCMSTEGIILVTGAWK